MKKTVTKIYIRHRTDTNNVHEIEVPLPCSVRTIDRIVNGASINLNHEDYYIDDKEALKDATL